MGKIREFFRRGKKKTDPRNAYLKYGHAHHPSLQGSNGQTPLFNSPLSIPPPCDFAKRLPDKILAEIFAQVCPHSQDGCYIVSEDNMPEDVCMSCDLRDLAHCALACKSWANAANPLLYTNIRIDSVHYCELELYLSKLRKKAHFDRNAEPIDAPRVRLELLCRTLRDNQDLAQT
ncbi:hypothetical protein KEM56_005210 [Ascosphaera pollenicola]|nr:hypothetical protein KEM56_005210 [Ascosphaera pollenicola]